MASSLPFDFFAGLARRIATPRVTARHSAAPTPLTLVETSLYLALAAGLCMALGGVIVQQHAFFTQRVAVEDAERRNSPELLGDLIRENDRVIGISVQQVYDVARVDPPPAPRAIAVDQRVLDGALAAAQQAPVAGEPQEPIPLAHAAHWKPRDRDADEE